jgi:hypothetical protein
MNREDYIKHREELIKVILKKCVTDNYPMVEEVTVNTGKEKNMSLWNKYEPYDYIFYYSIGIKCSPNNYSFNTFQNIKNIISFLKPYFLEENEHIRRIDELVDYKFNFPTF